MTPEVRARISASLSGRVIGTPALEHRRELSDAQRGKFIPPESRDHMSVAQRAKGLRDDLPPQTNNASSGIRGATWDKSKQKWQSQKRVDGVTIMRRFKLLEDAARYVDAVTSLARIHADAAAIKQAVALAYPIDKMRGARNSASGVRGVKQDTRTGRWLARSWDNVACARTWTQEV